VSLHGSISVGDCIGAEDLVAALLELVVEHELVVGALLRRIQVVDFFLVRGVPVRNVSSILVPARLPALQLLARFGRVKTRLLSLQAKTKWSEKENSF